MSLQWIKAIITATSKCVICACAIRSNREPNLQLCDSCYKKIPFIDNVECLCCGRAITCNDCARRSDGYFIMNRSVANYDDTIRDWLSMYKYRGLETMQPLLAELMNQQYMLMLQELRRRTATFNFDALVPIPLSERRLQERGFNQAQELAATIARCNRIAILPLLQRSRHTEKQSLKSRSERLADMSNLFVVNEDVARQLARKPLRILLIDDIYTTGSTLNGCAKSIMEWYAKLSNANHVSVYGLTFARS